MCGRYRLLIERDMEELNRIIGEVLSRHPALPEAHWAIPTEVFPTDRAPVLTAEQGGVAAELFVWGFPGFQGKGVVINARAETAAEKPLFRESLRRRRCAVPTTGFYEWSHTGPKRKFLFTGGSPVLYLAGLYMPQPEGENRFVILTTGANASMWDIHDRMPVLLPPEAVEDWIFDDASVPRLLTAEPPRLDRELAG